MRKDNFVLRNIILLFEPEKTILALQIILFPPELEYRKKIHFQTLTLKFHLLLRLGFLLRTNYYVFG